MEDTLQKPRFSVMLKASTMIQVRKSIDARSGDTLRQKKIIFDDTQEIIEKTSSIKVRPSLSKRLEIKPSSVIKPEFSGPFLCSWFPVLFGVDEDFIPSSDEEGVFDDSVLEDLQNRANALTESDLDYLRTDSRLHCTNAELRELWKEDNIPRYKKKERAKPILKRDNNTEFECKCDIDLSFSRHYIPHFGGGVKAEGEELKIPHFVGFWEEYQEKIKSQGMENWSDIIAKPPEIKRSDEQGLLYRPIPKFPSSSTREIKNFRLQILKNLRSLSCREIRRFRMPFAEALYLELQEDRYYDSAIFFKYLLVKDYLADPKADSVLRQSKSSLIKITRFLKLSENFARKQEINREVITLLKSGKYFTEHDENWWWLGEEFYKKAVKSSQKTALDGGKWEAISRYILGMFYLNYAHEAQLAQEHLSKARELSIGKDWNAEIIFKRKQDPVSKECSNYLCQALIASSKELRNNGKPNEALPLIHRSYKLCKQYTTFQPEVVMETYFELGLTYQALGMLDWAKVAFRKFLEIAKMENLHRNVCDGYLEMAITFRNEGDLPRCRQNLLRYLETAQAYKDENLIAYGNRYLGEYHLNNGYSKFAGEFFLKSFQSFYKQLKEVRTLPLQKWSQEHYTLMENVELTRTLVGLAEGEIVTKAICNLILQMKDRKNQREANLIINWKNKKGKLEDWEIKQYSQHTITKEPSVTSEQFEEEIEELGEEEEEEHPPKKRVIRFAPEPEKIKV